MTLPSDFQGCHMIDLSILVLRTVISPLHATVQWESGELRSSVHFACCKMLFRWDIKTNHVVTAEHWNYLFLCSQISKIVTLI